MAKLLHLSPPCGLDAPGVVDVRALDARDFTGYTFKDDGLFDSCYVTQVRKVADFSLIGVTDNTRKTSTLEGDLYRHTLTTYLTALGAAEISELHLAAKMLRFVIFYKTAAGKWYSFGADSGAKLTYTVTEDGSGALLTLSALSALPLFEVDAEAIEPTGLEPSAGFPYIFNFNLT